MSARSEIGIFVYVTDIRYVGTASVYGYTDDSKEFVKVVSNQRGNSGTIYTVPTTSVSHIPGTPKEVEPGRRFNRSKRRKLKKYLLPD